MDEPISVNITLNKGHIDAAEALTWAMNVTADPAAIFAGFELESLVNGLSHEETLDRLGGIACTLALALRGVAYSAGLLSLPEWEQSQASASDSQMIELTNAIIGAGFDHLRSVAPDV